MAAGRLFFGVAGLCARSYRAGLRARTLLAFLCALTLPAPAATVTPATATNYYFSAPLYPAHIRGEVMGDPPAYRTVRSEDADWLFEAFQERFALRTGSLLSALPVLSSSARDQEVYQAFSTVFIANVLDNSACEPGYYLDATAPTTGTARVAFDWNSPPALTNIYTATSYTNATTNAFSTISMPMTNGTVSVYTNQWQFTYPDLCAQTVTNVRTAVCLDFCHAGDGMFPGYSNYIDNAVTPLIAFRPGSFARTYAALRGAVRLGEQAATTNLAPPVITYSHVIFPDSQYEREGYTTNATAYVGAEYSIRGLRNISGTDVHERSTSAYYALAPSRFDSDLVTTGGVVRVSIDAAYAVCEFQYQNASGTAIDKAVVVPLDGPELLTGYQPSALVRALLDARALLVACASAAGVPAPPASAPGYAPAMGENSYWSVNCSDLVIIYRTHPTSKFDAW